MDDLRQPVELQPGQAYDMAHAAFRENDPEALEQAHRHLYSLYVDGSSHHPSAPDRARLEYVRAILEDGFRRYLDARREGFDVHLESPPIAETRVLSRWMDIQVFARHPADAFNWSQFVRDEASLSTMKHLVAQRSLFYLREPDPWIYALPTLRGGSKAGLIDLMLDEYGWGKLERMHSSIYGRLMDALDIDSGQDIHAEEASWQYLATLNHQWMCALNGPLSRRLLGTIYLTQAGSSRAMRDYLAAWNRLGIDDPDVRAFYELHARTDENYSSLALDHVVLPVCQLEGPKAVVEIATGIFDARTLEDDFVASEIESAKVLL